MNTKASKLTVKNRIKEVLNSKGFKTVTPTEAVLNSIGITLHRFNKIADNKVDVTAGELIGFSNWLNIPIDGLIDPKDK
ncbi:hypothetical protein [Pseudopedobacter beijingensis]|uniref:HTH cro/C1-type domain-containing protein n=1 Tax=Pseudopedobacter beijingensis TaxID=1207056 RepID=A0ABW4IGY2_9SPHI